MPSPRGTVARALWALVEPLHALTYFAPEPVGALKDVGYRGFWMGYFAGRAAPLGAVGPAPVEALFYNFSPARVARALPDAWEIAAPAAALDARLAGSVAALERCLGPVEEADVLRAATLLERAVAAAPPQGRPLGAANQALPTSENPLARLWQAATTLREHRGDGHVAALLAHGLVGREVHVLHGLAHGTPAAVYETARDLPADEWARLTESLRGRGLVEPGDDALSEEGRAVVGRVEDVTDTLSAPAYSVLDDAEVRELATLLTPWRDAVVAAGDIPLRSPMGLDLRGDSS